VAGDPQMRASDADRDRATALLREHHAAGRLTAEEFQERMDQALEARTLGQLDALMTDLPAIDLHRLPGESVSRVRPGSRSARWPAATGGPVARRPPRSGGAGIVLVAGVIVAAYLALGLAAGIWWIPWWLLVFIPLVLRRRRP
jgi:hypothetical protein